MPLRDQLPLLSENEKLGLEVIRKAVTNDPNVSAHLAVDPNNIRNGLHKLYEEYLEQRIRGRSTNFLRGNKKIFDDFMKDLRQKLASAIKSSQEPVEVKKIRLNRRSYCRAVGPDNRRNAGWGR
jgi:hypothetical protein